MGEEHGEITEVLGDGGVGGGAEGGLVTEEGEGGAEVAVEKEELRLVALRIALHLRLEGGEAELLGGFAGG